MVPPKMDRSEKSVGELMNLVIRIYHPNIRSQIASLRQNFAVLVLKGGARQQEWLNIYRVFSKLSASLDNHMLHEEMSFFSELGVGKEESGVGSVPSEFIALPQLEEEHHVILRQWKALEEAVNAGPSDPSNQGLINDARFELANLETAIIEHEHLESLKIYPRLKKDPSKQGHHPNSAGMVQ